MERDLTLLDDDELHEVHQVRQYILDIYKDKRAKTRLAEVEAEVNRRRIRQRG